MKFCSEHVPPRPAPRIAATQYASFEHGLLRHSIGACMRNSSHADVAPSGSNVNQRVRARACMTVEFIKADGAEVVHSTVVPARILPVVPRV